MYRARCSFWLKQGFILAHSLQGGWLWYTCSQMKALFSPAFLLVCALSLVAQKNVAQPEMRHYSSELGFELQYAGEWSANALGQVAPMTVKDLDQQALNDPFKRSIECTQKIFYAKLGDSHSDFVAGTRATECMGRTPDLDSFASRIAGVIRNSYKVSEVKYGSFSVKEQKFWLMRATAESRTFPGEIETIEYVATVLPRGLVYWSVNAKDHRALSSFEHSRVLLKNGVETELVPANAFSSPQPPPKGSGGLQAEGATGLPFNPDPKASHHFESGVGFSYEVLPELSILSVKPFEAAIREKALQHTTTEQESKSIQCAQLLLVAERRDESKIVEIIGFPQECAGGAITAENLELVGKYGAGQLAKKYNLINPEYGSFSAGKHTFWAMRSAMVPQPPRNPNGQIALVVIPIPGGATEWLLNGKTRADLDALMATRLKFEDGTETELIPAETFTAK